jgi:hypothetical protein
MSRYKFIYLKIVPGMNHAQAQLKHAKMLELHENDNLNEFTHNIEQCIAEEQSDRCVDI